MTTQTCPKCNGLLVLRKGKYGDFLGCTNYPKCKHTQKPTYKKEEIVKKAVDFNDFKPSPFQTKIKDQFTLTNKNLLVNATAGSGKTTLLLWLMTFAETDNILFLAFNKAIANELQSKITKGQASTLHSLGLNSLKRQYGRIKIDANKITDWLRSQVDKDTFRLISSPVRQIVSKYKNVYVDANPTAEKLTEIVSLYSIEYDVKLENEIFQWVTYAIQFSANQTSVVDFDDMIWLAAINPTKYSQYDVVFIDESQDLNNPQIAMLNGLAKRYIFVGDVNQAIYGFRGANREAMSEISTKFNCTDLTLPLTYRNSKSVTQFVNSMLDDIDHICLDDAPEGEVANIDDNLFYETVTENDMVICRNNAPLVKPCYALLRQGKKARIQGKDIAQTLIALIGKSLGDTLTQTLENVSNFTQNEIDKYTKLGYDNMVNLAKDKADTIFEFAEGQSTNEGLIAEIDKLFADNGQGTVFSTVHKAKGLESDTVFILSPDKLTTKTIEETCISFVAYTRPKNNLYLVI